MLLDGDNVFWTKSLEPSVAPPALMVTPSAGGAAKTLVPFDVANPTPLSRWTPTTCRRPREAEVK
jgi:hypothetical protein